MKASLVFLVLVLAACADNDSYDPVSGNGDLGSLEGNYALRITDLT